MKVTQGVATLDPDLYSGCIGVGAKGRDVRRIKFDDLEEDLFTWEELQEIADAIDEAETGT